MLEDSDGSVEGWKGVLNFFARSSKSLAFTSLGPSKGSIGWELLKDVSEDLSKLSLTFLTVVFTLLFMSSSLASIMTDFRLEPEAEYSRKNAFKNIFILILDKTILG